MTGDGAGPLAAIRPRSPWRSVVWVLAALGALVVVAAAAVLLTGAGGMTAAC